MLISSIGLLEPIQNQDHRIIPGCPGNPYRFIHTKCPLSLALPALYAKTVKAKRAVVEALAGRNGLGPEQICLLADRVGELAAEKNAALAKQAQRVLDGWGVVGVKPAGAPGTKPARKTKDFDAEEFNRVWPPVAETASRIHDGAHISAHWEDPDVSHCILMCHLTLPTGRA